MTASGVQETGSRPGLFGIGMFWATWRGEKLPAEYHNDPRRYNQRQMDLVRDAGGTNIPIGLGWISVEPESGRVDWSESDAAIEDARARGLDMIAYVGHTPDWAVPPARPGEEPLPGWRTPPDEAYADRFEWYCESISERYRGAVESFSFWNEPNGCSWVNNGCSNMGGFPLYTVWLKRAYSALKRGNPSCTVSAGSLDYNDGVPAGWRYIQGIYDEGGRDFFDAIDIHPYAARGVHWQAILDTRQVMLDNGDGAKPIWISEYGWQRPDNKVSCDELREFLSILQRDELSFVTHARYLVVSDLNEGLYGLCDTELRPRSIYHAFRDLSKNRPAAVLPEYATPYEYRPTIQKPNDADPSGIAPAIRVASPELEYNEEAEVELRLPSTPEKLVDVRWYVDGVRAPTSATRWYFARRPDARTEYAIRAEVEFETASYQVATTVTVRPFVSNEFTVVLDDAPAAIDRDQTYTLTTRVLNKSSHDLTWAWTVNDRPIPDAEHDSLVVSADRFGPGIYEFEVICVNAGMTSTARRPLQIL